MNKIISTLIFLVISQYGYAQLNSSELILNNGDKFTVLGKIKGEYFKYKKHSKDKAKKLHFSEIDYVKIHYSKNDIKTFRYFKIADTEKSKVLEEVEKGKVSLYTTSTNGYVNPFGAGMQRIAYTIENYYLKKQGGQEVIHLGSNQLFTKNFIEGASLFFEDCMELVKKIKTKKFKKRDIVDIVKFYNTHCN